MATTGIYWELTGYLALCQAWRACMYMASLRLAAACEGTPALSPFHR